MSGVVDLLEHADRDVGVNLSCVEAHVPQHCLDIADVCTAFEH